MKKIKLLFAITAMMLCMMSLAACGLLGGGDNTSPTKLVMSELSYDDTTKIVSWDKVTGASGYELKIDSGSYSSSGITENGSKMQYTISQSTSGDYIVSVIAKGDGTNYSNSEPKTKTITYMAAAGGGKTQVTLVMGELTYNDTTKIVSWDKLTGASGYTLRVGSKVKSSDLIIKNGNKMQYVMSETSSGEYKICVKAIGSETATHIYADSVEVSDVFYFTKPVQKQEFPLSVPLVSYNPSTNTVHFNPVEYAVFYELRFDGVIKTPTFSGIDYRFALPSTFGSHTVTVKALMAETDSHIYSESKKALITIVNGEKVKSTPYDEINVLIERRAEALWKANNPSLSSKLRLVEIKGINLHTGLAYVTIECDKAETIYYDHVETTLHTLNLGVDLPGSIGALTDYIIGKQFVKTDISDSLGLVQKVFYNTTSHNQEDSERFASVLQAMGEIPQGAILWATSTVFEEAQSGIKFTNMVVALDSGNLINLRVSINTSGSGMNTYNDITDYFVSNQSKGTISNKTNISYTDLMTLDPAFATYAEIVALVEKKAAAVWKASNPSPINETLSGVEVKGICLYSGYAYVLFSHYFNGAKSIFYRFELGELKGSMGEIKTQIENATYVSNDLREYSEFGYFSDNLDTEINTSMLVAALVANNMFYADTSWALSTVFVEDNGKMKTDVIMVSSLGHLNIFTFTVTTTSVESSTVINDYINHPSWGTVSRNLFNLYTDLSTLIQ